METSPFHNLHKPASKKYHGEPLSLLLMLIVIVFISEVFIMYLLSTFPTDSRLFEILIDGTLLIFLIFPFLYFYFLSPLTANINQSRKMEVALSEANEFLEKVFSVTHVLIAYMDTRSNLIRVNRAYAEIHGFAPGDLIGINHFDLFPDDESKRIFTHAIETGIPCFGFEKIFRMRSGRSEGCAYWDWNLFPVKDESGVVGGAVLSLIDVTHRRQAQEAMDEVERRFHAIFNQTFQAICLLKPDGTIVEANKTFLNMHGFGHSIVDGRHIADVLETCLTGPMTHRLRKGLRSISAGSDQLVRLELEIKNGNCQPVNIDVSIKPVKPEQGEVTHMIFEGRDITHHKRAERAIQENARQAMVLSRVSELLLHVGPDFQAVVNTVAESTAKLVGDLCIVRLLTDDGEWLMPAAASNRNPEMDEAVAEIMAYGRAPTSSGLEGHVMRTGEMFFTSLPENAENNNSLDPETRHQLKRLGIHSSVTAPLWVQSRLAGAVTVLRGHNSMPYDGHELELLRMLASKASLAIQNARLFEEVCDQRERLKSLSRRMVQIQETERRHIARELHDEAGQTLTSLMVALRLLEREVHQPEAVIAGIAEMKSSLDNVLENLHRLGTDLRPASLDHLGLVAALRQHILAVSSKCGINAQFEPLLSSPRLPPEMEISLYRIVQEALTNVIRHARAARVDVLLEQRADRVILLIEDDGIGFDPVAVMNNGRLGLFGMRERVEALGGKLTIESTVGQGALVQVDVPYEL